MTIKDKIKTFADKTIFDRIINRENFEECEECGELTHLDDLYPLKYSDDYTHCEKCKEILDPFQQSVESLRYW